MLKLEPQNWYGWTQFPCELPGLASRPVRILDVRPMKTGNGILEVKLLDPLSPGSAALHSRSCKILHRGRDQLAAITCEGDVTQTAVISAMSLSWLQNYCEGLLRRRPPEQAGTNSQISDPRFVEEYLARVFGDDEREIQFGAQVDSFGCERHALPARRELLLVDKEYSPFDSVLIARGFVPREMEDKWFIVLEAGRLVFRRSWTGFVIFEVAAVWRGETLYLGEGWINRDPQQNLGTSTADDQRLFQRLIEDLLIGS